MNTTRTVERPSHKCARILAVWLATALGVHAELRLPNVLSDGMVVQRGQPVHVWGWDLPGQKVGVSMAREGKPGGALAEGRAGTNGFWEVRLPEQAAGGPWQVDVTGSSARRITDVMVGEVWLCAGQSNMHWSLGKCTGGEETLTTAEDPGLRLLVAPLNPADTPQDDLPVRWNRCTPTSTRHFSGVGYYFGRRLRHELGVPVGLIQVAMGSATAATFIDRDTQRAGAGGLRFSIAIYDKDYAPAALARRWEAYRTTLETWFAEHGRVDSGISATSTEWNSPTFDDTSWATMELPQLWQRAGLKQNGVVWFRRAVDVPANWKGEDLSLFLGPIMDTDTTWWNGERIGGIGLSTPAGLGSFRTYTVPSALVREHNVLSIRVTSFTGFGGFGDEPEWFRVEPQRYDGRQLPLTGAWRYRVERLWNELPAETLKSKPAIEIWAPQKRAGAMFDGMVAPFARVPVAGAIIYQGESDSWLDNHTHFYYDVFPAWIASWRKAWNQADLPFLFVQLPNKDNQPTWPEFRNAQAAALALPHTAMAVTIDVGDPKQVHAPDKRPVGERLAGMALQDVYGRNLSARSPMLRKAEVHGRSVRVSLSAAEGLRVCGGGAVAGVELVDTVGVWHPASATVEDGGLRAEAEGVTAPAGVRYAWVSNPAHPLLENGAGLPAAPFRVFFAQPQAVAAARAPGKKPERISVALRFADHLTQTGVASPAKLGFEVAGADGAFRAAMGTLGSDGLTIWCSEIPEPARVRYTPRKDGPRIQALNGLFLDAFELPVPADGAVPRKAGDRP